LNTYGWINKTQGILAIPIQEAFEYDSSRVKNIVPVRTDSNAGPAGLQAANFNKKRSTTAEGGRR